jgi:hypothetical protein
MAIAYLDESATRFKSRIDPITKFKAAAAHSNGGCANG